MRDRDDVHEEIAQHLDDRYNEQDPATVIAELAAAAEQVAANFDSIRDDEWERTGLRSDGAHFTITTFAQYFVHDPVHHVDDVERGFALIAGTG